MTVTLMAPNCVGIWPEANDGAVLQIMPAAGVVAGTRFAPLITIKVFCAMLGPPLAVPTEVMTEAPPVGGAAPAWVAVKDTPAMVSVALKLAVELLASTVRITEPVPVPELGPETEIQVGRPVTLHAQAAVVWTAMV